MRLHCAVVSLTLACNSPEHASQEEASRSETRGIDQDLRTPSAPLLEVGDPAPAVRLKLQDEREVELAKLRGEQVVLFFYPMDDTPGCRAEAHGFRDLHDRFLAEDARVFGVSLQGIESHIAFIEKEGLPFDLAADEDASVSRAFGVPIRGQVTARQTFLVDQGGRISQIWRTVAPRSHAKEVLAAVENGRQSLSSFPTTTH